MKLLFQIVLSYLSGSLMFSYWLGKIAGKDIREFGDRNPGSVNAFKAGGWKIGVPAMLFDFFKGFIPIYIIYQSFLSNDIRILPIAIAPILGHAFSPFLKFKGGKAIAPSFGVWAGLTLWQGPMVLGLGFFLLKFVLRIKKDAIVILLGFILLLMYLLIFNRNIILISILLVNLTIIIYKHKTELI
jgi:glycerol-3-phosphate acyltransferase PlsY